MTTTFDVASLASQIGVLSTRSKMGTGTRTSVVNFDLIGLSSVLKQRDNQTDVTAIENKIDELNAALAAANPTQRRNLATELLKLWMQGEDNEVSAVYGDIVKLRVPRRAMFTLTGDGKQLRVWYGFPGHMRRSHVDSCGTGLLFGVYGDRQAVEEYLESFREISPLWRRRTKSAFASLWASNP